MKDDKVVGFIITEEIKHCQNCNSNNEIMQVEVPTKMKGLNVTGLVYLCFSCYQKLGGTIARETLKGVV